MDRESSSAEELTAELSARGLRFLVGAILSSCFASGELMEVRK
jgi:hypothetical protein